MCVCVCMCVYVLFLYRREISTYMCVCVHALILSQWMQTVCLVICAIIVQGSFVPFHVYLCSYQQHHCFPHQYSSVHIHPCRGYNTGSCHVCQEKVRYVFTSLICKHLNTMLLSVIHVRIHFPLLLSVSM